MGSNIIIYSAIRPVKRNKNRVTIRIWNNDENNQAQKREYNMRIKTKIQVNILTYTVSQRTSNVSWGHKEQ